MNRGGILIIALACASGCAERPEFRLKASTDAAHADPQESDAAVADAQMPDVPLPESGTPPSGDGATGPAPTSPAPSDTVIPAPPMPSAAASASSETDAAVSGADTDAADSGEADAAVSGMTDAAATVQCDNVDPAVIALDETGRVHAECSAFDFQGNWYCYDDNINPTNCMSAPPWDGVMSGMCLIGRTTVGEDDAWGAGLGVSLNETPWSAETPDLVKAAYDAASRGLLGFRVTVSGDTGGVPLELRVSQEVNDAYPTVFSLPGTGTYDVLFEDLETADWSPSPGVPVDPSNIFDVLLQLVGGVVSADYYVCIEEIRPISADTSM